MRLVIATTNRNKVKEIRTMLDGVGVELETLDRWSDVTAPDETGRTFEENARQKAIYYATVTGELVVAEDSGLEIEALGGAPGVESARFGGADLPYPKKFALIDERLRAGGRTDRTARFVCALALARDSSVLFEARGSVEGRIVMPPRGTGGFGYDPVFFHPPCGRTLAEVSQAEKAAVSHRGKAFAALRTFLTRHRLAS
jgi:XTP/dITP diphosphohydrolase